MNYIQLGKNIRCFRQYRKLTQEDLAERVNISGSYMTMIENGTRNVSLDILIRLANELHVPLDYLICSDYSLVLKNLSAITSLYGCLEKYSQKDLNGLYHLLSILSEICFQKYDGEK